MNLQRPTQADLDGMSHAEKPSGGRVDHPGKTLRMVETPDVVVDVRPSGVCVCGRELSDQEAALKERCQQIDLLEPRVVVTEYRQWSVPCACGRARCEAFPGDVTPNVSYGAR